jgi:hypothetical protein
VCCRPVSASWEVARTTEKWLSVLAAIVRPDPVLIDGVL